MDQSRSEDVTSRLARRDQIYVSPGPEMFYQGVRQEHSLVLDLGDVKAGDRIVLFLSGWIFYTDTSINYNTHLATVPEMWITRDGSDSRRSHANQSIGAHPCCTTMIRTF